MSVQFLRGLTVLSSLVTLAGGAAAWHQWSAPMPGLLERPLAVWEPPAAGTDDVPAGPPAAASYPETFARPLFAPGRRPFALLPPPPEDAPPLELPPELVVLEPPPAPQADASGLALKGVMIGDAIAQALILSAASDTPQWLTTGSEVQGFRLVAIRDDRVILEAGPQKLELKLYADPPGE